MDHFYQNIEGWFSYENLYREAVANAKDGAHFVEIGSWQGSGPLIAAQKMLTNYNLRFVHPHFIATIP